MKEIIQQLESVRAELEKIDNTTFTGWALNFLNAVIWSLEREMERNDLHVQTERQRRDR